MGAPQISGFCRSAAFWGVFATKRGIQWILPPVCSSKNHRYSAVGTVGIWGAVRGLYGFCWDSCGTVALGWVKMMKITNHNLKGTVGWSHTHLLICLAEERDNTINTIKKHSINFNIKSKFIFASLRQKVHVQEGRQHTVNHFQVRGVALPVRGGGGREGGGSSAYVDTTATARPPPARTGTHFRDVFNWKE